MGTFLYNKKLSIICDFCSDVMLRVNNVTEGPEVVNMKYGTVKAICDECRNKYHIKLEWKKSFG